MTRRPLVLVPQSFGSLVFDRRSSRYMPFDRESTEVLLETSKSGLARTIQRAPAELRDAVASFCAAFHERGFFTVDGRLDADILRASPPDDCLLGPLALHLEVVAACNLTCTHCFAGALPRKGPMLALYEIDRLFDELAAMGTFRLGLTGGEPLMRRELFDIVDCAIEHGLHPCITTNGLLLDEEKARALRDRELLWLNVSLDGATAETNDRVRGAGTFERVLEKIALLRALDVRFTLAFTLMSTNVHEIEACAALAAGVGADTAVFRPLYPVGVAKRHPELMPTFDDYAGSLERLERTTLDGSSLRAIDPFSPRSRAPVQAKVHRGEGCGAANLIATVSAHGDVSPCSFLGSEFDAANVRERSFADIWRNHPRFAAMRALSRVEDPSRFQGGCRARALAFNGDADAPDPWERAHRERAGSLGPTENRERASHG